MIISNASMGVERLPTVIIINFCNFRLETHKNENCDKISSIICERAVESRYHQILIV